MIDYNFYELIQDKEFPGTSLIEETIDRLSKSLNKDKLIDTIWEQINTTVCEKPLYIDPDTANALKHDILMSLYVSAKYTVMKEHEYKNIASELKDIRTTIQDLPHGDPFKTKLDTYRKNLKKSFQTGGNVLTSGQLFERNPLLYFKQFWDDGTGEYPKKFKCFNLDNYVSYIEAWSSWPFTLDNYNGMSFFNFFKGIHLMTTKDKDSKNEEYMKRTEKWDFYSSSNTDAADFEDNLSAYILEQLFSPVSFIQNVHLHIESFANIFSDNKKPDREKSIILMSPLFKLPRSLWEKLSGDYISALKKYITSPSDIDSLVELGKCMYKTIYHSQYTFPCLKILLANVLYIQKEKSLEDITSALEKYIENNIGNFDYFTALKKSMVDLAEYRYPTSTVKPLDSEGYKKIHPEFESKGNDNKRNNFSIESYEINFTHTFFCFKYLPEFKGHFLYQIQMREIDTPIDIPFLLEILNNTNSLPMANQEKITILQSVPIDFPLKISLMDTIEPPIIIRSPFTIQTPAPIAVPYTIQTASMVNQITAQPPYHLQTPFTLRPPFTILPPFTVLRNCDLRKELTDYIIKNIKNLFFQAKQVILPNQTPNYLSQKQKGFIMFPLED